jgi:hypothetical protein
MSMEYLVQARHLGGFRVWLRFNDGLEGEIDLAKDLWGPIFEPVRDERYFAAFLVDDTLTWPNGADFAPEMLYERVKAVQPRQRPSTRKGAKAPARKPRPKAATRR